MRLMADLRLALWGPISTTGCQIEAPPIGSGGSQEPSSHDDDAASMFKTNRNRELLYVSDFSGLDQRVPVKDVNCVASPHGTALPDEPQASRSARPKHRAEKCRQLAGPPWLR
jgi:hypothetical protein